MSTEVRGATTLDTVDLDFIVTWHEGSVGYRVRDSGTGQTVATVVKYEDHRFELAEPVDGSHWVFDSLVEIARFLEGLESSDG